MKISEATLKNTQYKISFIKPAMSVESTPVDISKCMGFIYSTHKCTNLLHTSNLVPQQSQSWVK
jgi:hypothetical protein